MRSRLTVAVLMERSIENLNYCVKKIYTFLIELNFSVRNLVYRFAGAGRVILGEGFCVRRFPVATKNPLEVGLQCLSFVDKNN